MNRRSLVLAPLLPRMGPVIEATLFAGIDGAPTPPKDAVAWRSELPRIVALRLAGLGLSAAEHFNVNLPPDLIADLRNASRREAMKAFRLEVAMPNVISVLESSGISPLVTKGPGVARAYKSSAQRPFRDIDVLVEPRQFADATRTLEKEGFTQPVELMQPRDYFGRLCREAITLQNDDRVVVDLHHRIPPWVWGERLVFAELYRARRQIQLDTGSINIPGSSHAMLIGVLHVLSDLGRKGYELLIWRDLIALSGQVDPKEVREEARRLDLDWAVGLVLKQLPSYAQPSALVAQFEDVGLDWSEAFRLRRILPPGKLARHPIARAFRLPVANAISYVIGYALPSREFLKMRYGAPSLLRWWKDAVRRLVEAD